MMKAACPRCVIFGRSGERWHATGRFVTKVKLGSAFIAAELVCDTPACECYGRTWTTGCRDAVDAGQRVREERGEPAYALNDPADPPAPTIEQPKLPHSQVRQPRDLTPVGKLVTDFRRRQSGDDAP